MGAAGLGRELDGRLEAQRIARGLGVELPLSASLRRAAAGFLFKFLSSPLERACRLLVVLVAAPALGATDFGTYQFASTVTAMLAAGTELGLGTWTTRALAREPARAGAIMATGLWIRSAAALPYVFLLAAVVALQPRGDSRRAMLVFGAAAAANSLVDYFGAIMRGREDFRHEATVNAMRAVLTTLSALAALGVARSLLGLSLGMALGATLGAAFAGWFLFARYRELVAEGRAARPTRAVARAVVREAVPLWLSGLLAMLYFRSDIVFVRYFSGDAEVGAYAAAYRIFEATLVLPSAVMAVAFPRLVRARGAELGARGATRRVTPLEIQLLALLLALGLVVAAGISLADDRIVGLLLGATFDRSIPSLRVLALTVPTMFVSFALCYFVIARGLERGFAKVLGAMLALNVGLNLTLVPRRGGVGAAWATLATELALIAACGALLVLSESRAAESAG